MYRIANTIIEVTGIHEKEDMSRLDLFRCEDTTPDVTYHIHYVPDLTDYVADQFLYQGGQISVAVVNGRYRYYHAWNDDLYAVVDDGGEVYDVYLDQTTFELRYHPYLIPSLFSMERFLIRENAFVFHSSYIVYEDRGILFTAPSGGGKSTQAALWEKYRGAVIANGDKSIVGLGEIGQVYGLPFSGSSDYCRNETHPLAAIVILKKGPSNQVKRMGLGAFQNLLSQITMNPWDEDYCEAVMSLVAEACERIPIYLYTCTKEEAAVDDLETIFKQDGVL